MTNCHLEERALRGFHNFLIRQILPNCATGRKRALDLGAGSGALAVRMRDLGLEVLAVDIDAGRFRAPVPFVNLDLNDPDFARSLLPEGGFDLITAVEVIEHLESPIRFLRSVRWLLNPGGTAVITTPNVDNLPARTKFLLRGRLRTLDERSEHHITPVFWDLFTRQWLPRAGLNLVGHQTFPLGPYPLSRPRYALAFWAAAKVLTKIFGGECLLGDSHVFILKSPG